MANFIFIFSIFQVTVAHGTVHHGLLVQKSSLNNQEHWVWHAWQHQTGCTTLPSLWVLHVLSLTSDGDST